MSTSAAHKLTNALPADAAAVSALLQPDEPVFCFSASALAARKEATLACAAPNVA